MQVMEPNKLLLAFLVGIGGAIGGAIAIGVLVDLFSKTIAEISFGGDKQFILVGLLFGAPVGTLCGICWVLKQPTVLSVLLGLLFGFMAAWVALMLLGLFGAAAIAIAPVIVTSGSLVGYLIGYLMFGPQTSKEQNGHKNGA